MSVKNVKAFYQRLAQDEQFRSELQAVQSKEECSHLVQEQGYYFTQEEFETYTAELLESSFNEGELQDLNEKELEAVFGGAIGYYKSVTPKALMYGVVMPMYGLVPVIPPDDLF